MWNGGNQWSAWVGYLSAYHDIFDVHKQTIDCFSPYKHLCELSGPRIMTEDFCMISDRPEFIHMDEQNRPHCATGPFCRWRDGWELYYWHGVQVEPWIINNPEKITVEKIDEEKNAEMRRILLERFPGGMSAFLKQSKARKIHSDDYGSLYERKLKSGGIIWMVVVICPSTGREYVLRVNSSKVKQLGGTARAAVASTWRKRSNNNEMVYKSDKEYAPLVET